MTIFEPRAPGIREVNLDAAAERPAETPCARDLGIADLRDAAEGRAELLRAGHIGAKARDAGRAVDEPVAEGIADTGAQRSVGLDRVFPRIDAGWNEDIAMRVHLVRKGDVGLDADHPRPAGLSVPARLETADHGTELRVPHGDGLKAVHRRLERSRADVRIAPGRTDMAAGIKARPPRTRFIGQAAGRRGEKPAQRHGRPHPPKPRADAHEPPCPTTNACADFRDRSMAKPRKLYQI